MLGDRRSEVRAMWKRTKQARWRLVLVMVLMTCAVAARTGKAKWRWDPEIARQHVLDICCGPSNRGVALYNGKVYAGLLDGRLVALDQETGKLLWQVQTTENPDTILTAAIRVVKGKVIVGTSGADNGVRGDFGAYDAETGKRLWRFYTV